MKMPIADCRLPIEQRVEALPMNRVGPSCRSARTRGSASLPSSALSGFTMVEIALCLAIIGFALVAIIGVLPTGMAVQKDNREETIINHDAAVWMDAIRSGAQGYDDLANHVIAITNYVWHYTWNSGTVQYELDSQVGLTGGLGPSPETNVFTPTSWWRNGALQSGNPSFLLTNGLHIIGVLSRPRIEWSGPANDPFKGFYLNYVVANVRAMSGGAAEKFPQTDQVILESAFSYRIVPEIQAFVPFDTSLIQANLPAITNALNPPQTLVRTKTPFDPSLPDINSLTNDARGVAYWDKVRENRRLLGVAYTNSHELRLTFRWPLLPPHNAAGPGRQTFRSLMGGELHMQYPVSPPGEDILKLPLYFFQPQTYVVK